ncbi:hypothetical protein D3C72_1519890 [compost metagenome]
MSPIVVGKNSRPAQKPQRYDCGLESTSLYGANILSHEPWLAGLSSWPAGVAMNTSTAITKIARPDSHQNCCHVMRP